jgi:uncharacterized membrane protein (DUF441 family)
VNIPRRSTVVPLSVMIVVLLAGVALARVPYVWARGLQAVVIVAEIAVVARLVRGAR